MFAFNHAFNKINTTIEYNESWDNGTGYLDGAVKEVQLAPGQMAKAETKNDRRVILVGTVFGTCVCFERFSAQGDKRSEVLVTNVPREARAFIPNGRLEEQDFLSYFAFETSNIGTKLDWVVLQASKINAAIDRAQLDNIAR